MKKTFTVLSLVLILAFSFAGCGGGSGGGGNDGNGNNGSGDGGGTPEVCKYAGNWTGTWTNSVGESGAASINISDNGAMTGSFTWGGVPTSSFSGQVSGNAVSFRYQFSGGPQLNCSGTLGAINNNQVQLTFTISESGITGTCSLTKS
jgi:predicted small secreted protein